MKQCHCSEKAPSKLPFYKLRQLISGLRLFPKSHDFFGYFQRSGENIVKGTAILCEMVNHKERRAELLEKLKEHEHIGDNITHEVIDLLHCTFLTPFDRSDIYTLVVRLDDILDLTYYVGNRLTMYDISEVPSEMRNMANIVHSAATELSLAIFELKDLKNSPMILKRCIEINRLEHEADDNINIAIRGIFKNGWKPLEVIQLKELLENLENAVDKCEDVANIIEGTILKHA